MPSSSDRLAPAPTLNRRTLTKALAWGALSASVGSLTFTEWAHASGGWEKIDDSDGIEVFKKDVAGSKLHAFRGKALIDAPMEKLFWVLADNTHRTEWVDRLKKSVILEKKNDYDFVVYQHFGSPAMISDRDFVYRAVAHSRPDGSAVLEINSISHPKAPATVGVRGELKDTSYVLTPQGNKTHVDVTVMLDPKGALPAWLVNLVQKSWPKNTLSSLRKHVKKPFVGTLAAPPKR